MNGCVHTHFMCACTHTFVLPSNSLNIPAWIWVGHTRHGAHACRVALDTLLRRVGERFFRSLTSGEVSGVDVQERGAVCVAVKNYKI